MITRLKHIPFGKAYVKTTNYGSKIITELVSYTTTVCRIVDDWRAGTCTLYVTGLYSATTRKHISAFMREYTRYDYYTAKRTYNTASKFDLLNGSYLPLEPFDNRYITQ